MDSKNIPTLDDFRASVRYLLITGHGTPAMVADELIQLDDLYLQRIFTEGGSDGASPMEAAEELAMKPLVGKAWVKLGEGQMVFSIGDRTGEYVDQLVTTGLFGDNPQQVVDAMVRRGIEAVLPVLQLTQPVKSNR
ncbi:hypothetical protein [Acidovorax delafieldii]|uniref:hypothetical protein n=1 Tax=Acidovorax delafieldii TaxID=47920 RepID=UPI003ED12670